MDGQSHRLAHWFSYSDSANRRDGRKRDLASMRRSEAGRIRSCRILGLGFAVMAAATTAATMPTAAAMPFATTATRVLGCRRGRRGSDVGLRAELTFASAGADDAAAAHRGHARHNGNGQHGPHQDGAEPKLQAFSGELKHVADIPRETSPHYLIELPAIAKRSFLC
jgi:hypothetical protein